MSIENQLKLGFKKAADQMIRPSVLDAQINQSFEEFAREKNRSRNGVWGHKKYMRIAVIVASLFMFSGIAYAATLLYQMGDNHVNIELSGDRAVILKQNQMDEIQKSINEVRNHLSPGESAFLFHTEMDKIKPSDTWGTGLVRVNRPVSYPDINKWKELVKQQGPELKTPVAMPDGFTFTKGELESPIGNINAANYDKYYQMLKQKAAGLKVNTVWQRAVPEDLIVAKDFISNIPRLVYTNKNNDQIEINYTLFPKTDMKFNLKGRVADSSIAEKVRISDIDGYYVANNNDMLSGAGKSKNVNWLEQKDGQTILYHVTSPSTQVTKDDLLYVANHLK